MVNIYTLFTEIIPLLLLCLILYQTVLKILTWHKSKISMAIPAKICLLLTALIIIGTCFFIFSIDLATMLILQTLTHYLNFGVLVVILAFVECREYFGEMSYLTNALLVTLQMIYILNFC